MQSQYSQSSNYSFPLLCLAMVLTAAAAGMGWGIRGQYGHETGAMIAGALASLTLVMLFIPDATVLGAARAAAMMTVAIGIGGQMTYGQTVGLTHDAEVVGNWEALRWGMLGLAVKGGIWIGFGATFLGMGLGGVKYRPLEMVGLFVVLIGLMLLGVWLFNSPYDPSNKELPWIYFSDDWYFEPNGDLKPRRETWGGLLVALLACGAYVRFVRGDRLAGRMMVVGMIAGGLGFPGGQSVQAFSVWNRAVFTDGFLSGYDEYFRYFNWWNMMETTFGMIFGAVLAFGLWINGRLVRVRDDDSGSIAWPVEVVLVVVHLALLLGSEFVDTDLLPDGSPLAYVEIYTNMGLLVSAIPIACIVGGRLWPFLMVLPIVTAPIVGKTIRNLVYQSDSMSPFHGSLYVVTIPMVSVTCIAIALFVLQRNRSIGSSTFAATSLAATTLCFFGLNTIFFHQAWPWLDWTGRTPNQIIFSICVLMLLIAAGVVGFRVDQRHTAGEP